MVDSLHVDNRDARRIAKFAKKQCCVCGKYGADEPFGEPLRALQLFAKARGLTLKLPDQNAVHPKCLRKLKEIVERVRRV